MAVPIRRVVVRGSPRDWQMTNRWERDTDEPVCREEAMMNTARRLGVTGAMIMLGVVLALAAVVTTSNTPVHANSHPDLVVGTPSVDDASLSTGSQFTLSVTVTNAGDGESEATTLRYYRSTDSTITSSDTAQGSGEVGALAAAGTSDHSGGLTAPSEAGTYYYGACVDSVTGESDTTNNCSSSVTVTVSEPAPDLVVLGPDVRPSSLETGGSFSLLMTVTNQGDAQSAATTLRYKRSTDATITTSDTSVGTDAVRALVRPQGYGGTIRLTAPSTPGTYYYGGCVDSVAGESDTTNNCSSSVTVTVEEPGPTPDLVALLAVRDRSLETGGTLTILIGVYNEGDGVSAATTVRYYRSTDATITTSDTLLGTEAVPALRPNLASSDSFQKGYTRTAPSTAGTYYYGSCVDTVAGESDTTDNCSSAVRVEVEEPAPTPDLVALLAVRDRSLETGGTLTILIGVYNEGDGVSAATTVRYYRSTDATITTSDTLLGTEAVPALRPNLASSDSFQKGYTRTASSTAGTYYYGSCVDAVPGESDTTNLSRTVLRWWRCTTPTTTGSSIRLR